MALSSRACSPANMISNSTRPRATACCCSPTSTTPAAMSPTSFACWSRSRVGSKSALPQGERQELRPSMARQVADDGRARFAELQPLPRGFPVGGWNEHARRGHPRSVSIFRVGFDLLRKTLLAAHNEAIHWWQLLIAGQLPRPIRLNGSPQLNSSYKSRCRGFETRSSKTCSKVASVLESWQLSEVQSSRLLLRH